MIFIGLGSSIGDAEAYFKDTERLLKEANIKVAQKSRNLKNPSFGGVAKNEFTNAVWRLEFAETRWEKMNWCLLPKQRRLYLKAKKLLRILQNIEHKLGRQRQKRWDDRTLDLDILQFHNLECRKQVLSVPHPEIPKRSFVLRPWQEIVDEDFLIPKFGALSDLISALK